MRANPDLPLDVIGVGNAIVDVISTVPDEFLDEHGLIKGAMTLIDTDRATSLYGAMPPGIEASGGSAANTMAGVASLGGRAAYIGKVRDDQLGEVFAHDTRNGGVGFDIPFATEGEPTARSLIQVTPDGERTMNTFLGISAFLRPSDIDEDAVSSAAITYCEGYLWDRDEAKDAIRHAMGVASDAGRIVSLTLSDSFCVDRHRDEWLSLLDDKVDLVFANEAEVCSMFETDDFDAAARQIASMVEVAALTRSADGSVVMASGERIDSPATPVAQVVDATGAGDLYASGFMYGLSIGASLERCAELGSIAAGEVITHMGARPHVELSTLI
ncbi:MAG: adenosine kinase [Actinomycetota bacterium]